MLELYGCPASLLDDPGQITKILEEAAVVSKSKLLNLLVHPFAPHGVTAVGLLAESHISVHTWPEYGYAAVDLFTCGSDAKPDAGSAYLIQALQARRHSLSTARRGLAADAGWMNEPLTPLDIYRRSVTNVLYSKRSRFQEICIAEAGAYGKSLILDDQLQAASADEFLYHEALVHPAMIQLSSPRSVLILGGGDGGAAREALRWRSVRRVTMVEIDREVVEACREHLPEIHQGAFDDGRLEVVIDDALDFLKRTDQLWDVIVSDLPDPDDGAPWLKLFARGCFETVHGRLSGGGCFVMQAGPVSPVCTAPLAQIARDLRGAFPHAHFYTNFIPSFGIPLAFVLAADRPFPVHPNPEVVDRVIAERVSGRLRMFDGAAFLGFMQTPAYLREVVRGQGLDSPRVPAKPSLAETQPLMG
ncbi:MAG: adenosylmethionine decarboxylase [Bryobacterales bacterium]|nr:adenosylmethionine decarboxylase [Bryobacterales bacterium]